MRLRLIHNRGCEGGSGWTAWRATLTQQAFWAQHLWRKEHRSSGAHDGQWCSSPHGSPTTSPSITLLCRCQLGVSEPFEGASALIRQLCTGSGAAVRGTWQPRTRQLSPQNPLARSPLTLSGSGPVKRIRACWSTDSSSNKGWEVLV